MTTFNLTIDPSVDNAAAVNELKNAINAANASNEADTINLFSRSTYTLSAIDNYNSLNGNNGLPLITDSNGITINGNGATIERAANAPDFRILTIVGTPPFWGFSLISPILNLDNLTLRNGLAIANETSGDDGGGIYNYLGTLNISNSTFSGNAAGDGGAIFNNGGTLTMTNSTISGNSATINGGGIVNTDGWYRDGILTLINSTITNNIADSDNDGTGNGGGVVRKRDFVDVQNTIIAGNFDTTNNAGLGEIHPDVLGEFISNGYNLIGDATGSTGFAAIADLAGNATNRIDPRLAPLQNNGGFTATHALLPGSLAINAGNNAFVTNSTDQRGSGFYRISGNAVDIGAYEYEAPINLVISEISYNLEKQWIALSNIGNSTIDLAGFILDDDDDALTAGNIANGAIAPGKTAILYDAIAPIPDIDDASIELIPVTNWSKLDESDRLGLWSSDRSRLLGFQNAIDEVNYNNSTPWPFDSNPASIYLTNLNADNNIGSNWASSAPAVNLNVENINVAKDTPHSFTVQYTDDRAINFNTLDDTDIIVISPNGEEIATTITDISTTNNSTSIAATYQINATGGSWDSSDIGIYAVQLQANEVSDVTGNFISAGGLGNFQVAIASDASDLTPVDDDSENNSENPGDTNDDTIDDDSENNSENPGDTNDDTIGDILDDISSNPGNTNDDTIGDILDDISSNPGNTNDDTIDDILDDISSNPGDTNDDTIGDILDDISSNPGDTNDDTIGDILDDISSNPGDTNDDTIDDISSNSGDTNDDTIDDILDDISSNPGDTNDDTIGDILDDISSNPGDTNDDTIDHILDDISSNPGDTNDDTIDHILDDISSNPGNINDDTIDNWLGNNSENPGNINDDTIGDRTNIDKNIPGGDNGNSNANISDNTDNSSTSGAGNTKSESGNINQSDTTVTDLMDSLENISTIDEIISKLPSSTTESIANTIQANRGSKDEDIVATVNSLFGNKLPNLTGINLENLNPEEIEKVVKSLSDSGELPKSIDPSILGSLLDNSNINLTSLLNQAKQVLGDGANDSIKKLIDSVECDCPFCKQAVTIKSDITASAIARNIDGNGNDDTIIGNGGNEALKGFGGNDILAGDRGGDMIFGGVGKTAPVGNSSDRDRLFGNEGNDYLGGNEGSDTICAGQNNDIAYGGKDDDLLCGDKGDDSLMGDLGNDSIIGGTGKSSIIDSGIDWMSGGVGDDFLNGNEGSDIICGGDNNDTIRGGKGNDKVCGAAGNDLLFGDLDDDTIGGDEGNDTLLGGNGSVSTNSVGEGESATHTLRDRDWLVGGLGNDLIFGNEGQDLANGGDGDDSIYGGKDGDVLAGSAGNDWLFGDRGDDILSGGLGSDRFVLLSGNGGETILDFEEGTDLLVLGKGLKFEQLLITSNQGSTSISVTSTSELLATLNGVEAGAIGINDFT